MGQVRPRAGKPTSEPGPSLDLFETRMDETSETLSLEPRERPASLARSLFTVPPLSTSFALTSGMPSDDAYLSESDDPDVYDADPDALPHPSGAGAGTSSAFAGGEGSSGAAGHAVPGGAAGTSARHGSGGPPSSGGNNAGDDDGVNKKRKIQRACAYLDWRGRDDTSQRTARTGM